MPCRRDSVGGGVVAEFFRDLQNPMRFSGGGGVVPEIFRALRKPTRFGGGGGSSAELFFSVTSKRHFLLSRRGARAPWATPPPESATASSLGGVFGVEMMSFRNYYELD